MMTIIKTEAFKTLIVISSFDNSIYHYDSFDDFVEILKNNYYEDIMHEKLFLND